MPVLLLGNQRWEGPLEPGQRLLLLEAGSLPLRLPRCPPTPPFPFSESEKRD